MKVWVNGTFDVLHRGHIELFRYAYGFGDVRVGIDYDGRVKQLKGLTRPINSWEDRKFFLESIKYVNSVVGFGSDEELEEQIKLWKPDYMIVGSDYKNKRVIGSQFSKQLLFFDRIENYSSTKIISHDKNFSNR
jgi:D-beta-D-heptose 7-phosphate kinase/D-beta-D-heptose 1-phosphate adenosyltransferase